MAVFWEHQKAFDVIVVLARHYRIKEEKKVLTLRFSISSTFIQAKYENHEIISRANSKTYLFMEGTQRETERKNKHIKMDGARQSHNLSTKCIWYCYPSNSSFKLHDKP